MFQIFLTFSNNKSQAPEFMQAHNEWIKQGIDEGVFLLIGSLKPSSDNPKGGGSIMANNLTYDALVEKINQDPFVVHDVVSAEIYEISPNQTDKRLSFLMPISE